MDEINYRRLTALPKQRCEDCGATCYSDPGHVFRCVVCDHDRYDVCLDCGHLSGWCKCGPATAAATPTIAKKRGRKAKPKAKA